MNHDPNGSRVFKVDPFDMIISSNHLKFATMLSDLCQAKLCVLQQRFISIVQI